MSPADTVEIVETDQESGTAMFDARAQKLLQISGSEFIRRYETNDLAEHEAQDHSAVMELIGLLSFTGR